MSKKKIPAPGHKLTAKEATKAVNEQFAPALEKLADVPPKKEYSELTKKIVADAKALAEDKKKQGWTHEDFAKALQEFFNEAIPLLAQPAGDWISNVHFDTLKHPANAHFVKDHDLGPPKASKKHNQQQLLDMGYCGMYMKKLA